MNEARVLIALIIVVTFLHAYKAFHVSAICGRFPHKDAVKMVYAVRGKDTPFKIAPRNSAFEMQAKPGMYTLIVEARQPYKNVVLSTIKVDEGKTTDIGRINVSRN